MLELASDVKRLVPDLKVFTPELENVIVRKEDVELEKFKGEIMKDVLARYDLASLKDKPTFRAYRDFFWRIGIDPTKNRPASEALIRRILQGKPIPRINTLVDSYNLASIKTEIAIAAFDADELVGSLTMRFAEEGEEFLGIGMEKPMKLRGGEIVVSDAEKLVAIYPYRDANDTKISLNTRNVLFLICGVPGIGEETLIRASKVTISYVTRFCGGKLIR